MTPRLVPPHLFYVRARTVLCILCEVSQHTCLLADPGKTPWYHMLHPPNPIITKQRKKERNKKFKERKTAAPTINHTYIRPSQQAPQFQPTRDKTNPGADPA
ncbi:uncharacterized protein CC84DRAFT_1167961 [Paraphaeosphaeria sporulosa]|uniref:Uncharacterized protein n=1 Tax=Paraphaeosphaeria sporulosa TaxID=1460663 RepID=A0A177C2X8_9PLEO|nr:uncharacterized protein CC84DRAFT_1167961 [Paraphaeosphaeria sporulosa]OAG01815.1 hypothetical protein CC84DRAFT_1167961 [Paraphaeosphaeria sporulosa]